MTHRATPSGEPQRPPQARIRLGTTGSLHWRGVATAVVALACVITLPAGAARAEGEPFAITAFKLQTTEPSETKQTSNEPVFFDQAGGHPFALTSAVKFNTGDPKQIIIDLPPGLLANPQAVPRCSGVAEHCPSNTQVGVFELRFAGGADQLEVIGEIVNMSPYPGVPAELGLEVPILGRLLLIGRVVRRPQGYSLSIVGSGLPVLNLSSVFEGGGLPPLHLTSMETTLWGVPAASEHDPQRGLSCLGLGFGMSCSESGGVADSEEPVPFLTMPTTCSGEPPTTIAWAASWEEPGRYVQAQSSLPQMTDCERSPWSPELSVRPETLRPEAPTGTNLTISVRQFNETIAAAPELRDATVTLPQGMSINPSVANGLQGCEPTGPNGINLPTGLNSSGEPLRPREVGPGEEVPPEGSGPDEPELAPGHCPNASVVGTAEATTPLLAHPLEGRVYIANPGCGGPSQSACTEQDAVDGNLYRLYVQLGAGPNIRQNEGILLKLSAIVQANPATPAS